MTEHMHSIPKYHPDVRFLTDYSAGSLPASQAICVASHLHYCSQCRARARELKELGTALFVRQKPVAVTPDAFERLLTRLPARQAGGDAASSEPTPPGERVNAPVAPVGAGEGSAPGPDSRLPRAIDKLCRGNTENLRWRGIGKRFRYAPLQLGDRERETSLLHIRAGGSVPRHQHRGDEITVVLQGSFSDNEDKYGVGDFIVRTPGEIHQPVASQDEDCLCLSTLDAPIRMSNWLLRLLMPLLEPKRAALASRH